MNATVSEGDATVVQSGLHILPFIVENMTRDTSTTMQQATTGPITLRPSAVGNSMRLLAWDKTKCVALQTQIRILPMSLLNHTSLWQPACLNQCP